MEDLERARDMERVFKDAYAEGKSVAALASRFELSDLIKREVL